MKKGFTLVELLVVVLIIGVLSAIAIPMYQGAVDKSHFSTLLPATRAIKNAEEAFKMANGEYSSEMSNLDVSMENGDITYTLTTLNNTSDPNVIRATSTKLANVRLASYLDDSPTFAGQLHCEAKTGDERAERLCDKLLMGQELTSADGYTAYLLDQEIDKATCDNANRSWSSSKTKCYKDDQTRCDALNMGYLGDGRCGYENNAGNGEIVGEEGTCVANEGGCKGVIINDGGVCEGNRNDGCRDTIINAGGTCLSTGLGHHGACAGSTVNDGGICIAEAQDGCAGSTVNKGGTCWAKGGAAEYVHWNYMCQKSTLNGGKCIGDGGGHPCYGVTVNDQGVCEANIAGACPNITVNSGGKCIANKPYTCTGTYNGGCCEGEYCPANAPKC